MIPALFARLGDSDCEFLDSGLLVQPLNAVSSLAYSVVGAAIVVWAFGVSGHNRVVRIVFGVFMIATGIGSVMFHGPQGLGSQFLHDITFLTALLFLAVFNLTGARLRRVSAGWAFFGAAWIGLVIALIVSPGVTNVLMVAVVVVLVISDVALFRQTARWTKWYVTGLVASAAAVSMFVLGRTDGVLCDPSSTFQGHAVWHVLGAVALGAYFVATAIVRETIQDSVAV